MTESKGPQKDTQRAMNTKRHLRTTKRCQTPKTCKTKFRNENNNNNNRDMQNIHGDVKRVLRHTKQLTEIKIEPWGCKATTKNHKTTKRRLKLTAKTHKSQTKTGKK